MKTRIAAVLAGVWAGLVLCIAVLAAPSAFATLAAPEAGRLVGRLFMQEAYLSLGVAIVLFAIERQRSQAVAANRGGSVFSANLVILLGTLFCTVAGYFALQPMMDAARAGQGSVSFMTLHLVSAGLFVLKALLVLALTWRLVAASSAATTS